MSATSKLVYLPPSRARCNVASLHIGRENGLCLLRPLISISNSVFLPFHHLLLIQFTALRIQGVFTQSHRNYGGKRYLHLVAASIIASIMATHSVNGTTAYILSGIGVWTVLLTMFLGAVIYDQCEYLAFPISSSAEKRLRHPRRLHHQHNYRKNHLSLIARTTWLLFEAG